MSTIRGRRKLSSVDVCPCDLGYPEQSIQQFLNNANNIMVILYIIDIFGVGEWSSRLMNTKWNSKILMICLLPIGLFPTYISVVPYLCISPNEAYDIMTICLIQYMFSISHCHELLFIHKKLSSCVYSLDPVLQRS